MNLFKQLFRKINLDSDVRTLKPGDYRLLKNGITVQPGAGSKSLMDVISNMYGNALVTNSLPSGTNTAIGFKQDRTGNRAFFFVANSTASNNTIYQYKNGAITVVLRNAVLDFLATDVVEADIVGDILIWTNGRTDIQRIDVVKAIAGATYTPTAIELALIKNPPVNPITWVLEYDYAVTNNNIYGNYFQFTHRYVYELNDYSVFGPWSTLANDWVHPQATAGSPYALNVECVTYTNLALTGVPGSVDGRTVFAGQRIVLLGQTTMEENGVWVIAAGAWARAADFAAAATATTNVYVKDGFFYVGKVLRLYSLVVAGVGQPVVVTILDGPNKITVSRSGTPPSTVKKIEYAVRINGSNEVIIYRVEKTGSFTTSHSFYNDNYLFTIPDADSFKWNDSVPLSCRSLNVFKNRIFLLNNVEGRDITYTGSLSLTIEAQTVSRDEKVFRVARPGGKYTVGVLLADSFGRVYSVIEEQTVTIPSDPLVLYRIRVSSLPTLPAWATAKIVVTKDLTATFFVGGYTQDVYYYKKNASGVLSYSKTLASFGAEGTAIDIGLLTTNNLGYTFSAGDKIRLFLNKNDASGESVAQDYAIKSQEGRFVFIDVVNFDTKYTMLTSDRTSIRFEIYTPKKVEQEPFFEYVDYAASSLIQGDVEYGNFTVTKVVGAYSATDPFANNYGGYTDFYNIATLQMTLSKNFPNWVTPGARSVIKSDSRQIAKTTYLRFGEQYIQNSEQLGLNTFYALNEYALPIENGPGVSIVEAGQVMVAISEAETSSVYVGEGFVNTGSSSFLTKTDSVIGDDQKYQGGHGSIHPRSIVSRDSRVYFLDARKGVIVRRSQDGLTVISQYGVKGLVSNLCETHLALGSDSRIVAGWDPQYDCYVISFVKISDNTGYTLYFHEPSNGWVCQSDIKPTLWGILEQKQIAFLGGQFWIQTPEANWNNWFGTQYNRTLEFEIAPGQSLECIWNAIEVDVETLFTTAGTNEDIVLLYHVRGGQLQTRINYLDFQKRASAYRSAFFRNINDASFGSTTESKYKSPDSIRGQSAYITIVSNVTGYNSMKSITVFYTPSMQSFQ